MELNRNQEDGCQGGAICALPACEKPALRWAKAAQGVTPSRYIDFLTITDLACEIDHKDNSLSVFLPSPASSLDEPARFQPVGELMSSSGQLHAEPTQPNSSVNSVQNRRALQDGLPPLAPSLVKGACGWADESGKGSLFSVSRFL